MMKEIFSVPLLVNNAGMLICSSSLLAGSCDPRMSSVFSEKLYWVISQKGKQCYDCQTLAVLLHLSHIMMRWQDWADVTVTEVRTVLLCDLQSATIGLLYHHLHIVKDEVKGHAPYWLWGLLHKSEMNSSNHQKVQSISNPISRIVGTFCKM